MYKNTNLPKKKVFVGHLLLLTCVIKYSSEMKKKKIKDK